MCATFSESRPLVCKMPRASHALIRCAAELRAVSSRAPITSSGVAPGLVEMYPKAVNVALKSARDPASPPDYSLSAFLGSDSY